MNYTYLTKLLNLAKWFEEHNYNNYHLSTVECLIGYLDETYCDEYVSEYLQEAYELKKDLKKLG